MALSQEAQDLANTAHNQLVAALATPEAQYREENGEYLQKNRGNWGAWNDLKPSGIDPRIDVYLSAAVYPAEQGYVVVSRVVESGVEYERRTNAAGPEAWRTSDGWEQLGGD